MNWNFALLLSLLSAALSGAEAEEKKWRWGDGERSAASREDRELERRTTHNDYSSKQHLERYEIYENNEGNFHNSGRPQNFRPPIDYSDRPGLGGGGVRPGLGQYGNGYGQGGYGGGGILTGPVPSWQKEPPFKEFDRCKCTEKFNCNSPGISYGHCDVGKKYCCYNTHGVQGSPFPNRPHHSIENGILAGPGGPIDHIPGGYGGGYNSGVLVGPGGPTGIGGGIYGRPSQHPGVLVGPGGPTGIIGRPGGNGFIQPRPPHGPGILVGPGGPTGIIGRPSGYGVGPGGILGRPGYEGPHGSYGGNFRPTGFGLGRSAKQKEEEPKK